MADTDAVVRVRLLRAIRDLDRQQAESAESRERSHEWNRR
jgi:hypothetical protein